MADTATENIAHFANVHFRVDHFAEQNKRLKK